MSYIYFGMTEKCWRCGAPPEDGMITVEEDWEDYTGISHCMPVVRCDHCGAAVALDGFKSDIRAELGELAAPENN